MRAKHISISKSISYGETLGEHAVRIKSGGARKPLRNLRELAEEFGIPHKSLQALLSRTKGAPKPIYSTGGGNRSSSPRNTWYEPDEVRRWYAVRGV